MPVQLQGADTERTIAVSGIVVNYHTPDTSLAAARSLLRAGADECVIVNNGGPRPIPTAHERVRVIDAGGNVGFGRGVNAGAAVARGRTLVLLNSDAECVRDGLGEALRVLSAVGGIVGSKELAEDGSVLTWAAPILTWVGDMLGAVIGNKRVAGIGQRLGPIGRLLYWGPSVSGGFMVVSADVFSTLGGFRPDFFMYGDDVDLCWRAMRLRIPVTLLDTPLYRHLNRGSPSSSDRNALIAESDALLARIRYGDWGAVLLLATRTVASWIGCLVLQPFTGVEQVRRVHAARCAWCRQSALTLNHVCRMASDAAVRHGRV